MSKSTFHLPVAVAAIAAATVIAACGSSSSNSSNASNSSDHPTQAQIQQDDQAAVRFADCMRSHGVPSFPDPTSSPRGFKSALDPSAKRSPAFQSALNGCGHLLPRSRGSTQSDVHSPAQIASFLAFARCLRTHGFPSFPDPTSSGNLTHEMLANAGINLHQPAVVQAADACVGVTHGAVTRADVARFIAEQ
jgi:hypothetical protein